MAGNGDADVDALYDLPVGEFVAARDALAKARRQAKDREGAAVVKALRRPSVVAWALNQVARRHPARVQALVDAADALVSAQAGALAGDRGSLRAAGAARSAAVRDLTKAADEVLGAAAPAHRAEVAAALQAAAVDPATAGTLLEGRLSEPPAVDGALFGFGAPDEGGVEGGAVDHVEGEPTDDLGVARAARARRAAGGGTGRTASRPAEQEGDGAPRTGQATAAAKRKAPLAAAEGARAAREAAAAASADAERRKAEAVALATAAAEAAARADQAAAAADAAADRVEALEAELEEARRTLLDAEAEAGRRRREARALGR